MKKRTIQQSVIVSTLLMGSASVLEASSPDIQPADHAVAVISLNRMNGLAVDRLASSPTCPIYLIAGSSAARTIRFRNNSRVITALNIRATNIWSEVTQDASDCAVVGPGKTCKILLTAGSSTHATMLITMAGINTTSVNVYMDVIPPLTIGQSWQGGLIYFIDPNGASGQVTATVTASNAIPWDPNNGSMIAGATSTTDGAANTAAIVNQLTTKELQPLSTYAAGACILFSASNSCSIFNDWYLPAVDQFTQIRASFVVASIVSLTTFWTSTQAPTSTQAYSQGEDSITTSSPKPNIFSVLCVRDFSYDIDPTAPV